MTGSQKSEPGFWSRFMAPVAGAWTYVTQCLVFSIYYNHSCPVLDRHSCARSGLIYFWTQIHNGGLSIFLWPPARTAIVICCGSFLPRLYSFFRRLISKNTWPTAWPTLPLRVSRWQILKCQKFEGHSPEICRPQNIKISGRFWTTSRPDGEYYLRNPTRYRQSENCVSNCTITPAETNSVWWTVVHKWRKIRPIFRPTQNQTFAMIIILGVLRGDRYPVKISRVVENDQRPAGDRPFNYKSFDER